MTVNAGSAIVVPNPIKKPNIKIQVTQPDLAKSLAKFSPTGKIPFSNPCKNIANPTATIPKPIAVFTQPSGTV